MRLGHGTIAAGILGMAITLWGAPAWAQLSPADQQRADQLYNEGKAALDAGRVDEACTKLGQSVAIDRGIGALLNLARCHELQGKTATAWREYTEASLKADQAGQTERAAGARELASKLAARLPRLTIKVVNAPPGLALQKDGAALPEGELDTPTPLDPGTHTITATAPGFEPFSVTVQVRPEPENKTVTVELRPSGSAAPSPAGGPTAPSTPPPSGPSDQADASKAGVGALTIAGSVVGGVGVVGVVVGAVFGVMTMNGLDDAENDPALCPNKQCTKEGRAAVDDAQNHGIISTIGFAVGGAAIATGVVLIVLDLTGAVAPNPSARQGVLPLRVGGAGDAGVSLSWLF